MYQDALAVPTHQGGYGRGGSGSPPPADSGREAGPRRGSMSTSTGTTSTGTWTGSRATGDHPNTYGTAEISMGPGIGSLQQLPGTSAWPSPYPISSYGPTLPARQSSHLQQGPQSNNPAAPLAMQQRMLAVPTHQSGCPPGGIGPPYPASPRRAMGVTPGGMPTANRIRTGSTSHGQSPKTHETADRSSMTRQNSRSRQQSRERERSASNRGYPVFSHGLTPSQGGLSSGTSAHEPQVRWGVVPYNPYPAAPPATRGAPSQPPVSRQTPPPDAGQLGGPPNPQFRGSQQVRRR